MSDENQTLSHQEVGTTSAYGISKPLPSCPPGTPFDYGNEKQARYIREYLRHFLEPPQMIKSRELHQAFLTYSIIPKDYWQYFEPGDRIRPNGKGLLALLYNSLYCQNDPPQYGPKSYHFPPSFYGILEDCLLFYFETLSPYWGFIYSKVFNVLWGENFLDFVGRKVDFSGILTRYISVFEMTGTSTISKRWKAGLLREEQIELLHVLIRAMFTQISTVINIALSSTPPLGPGGTRDRELGRLLHIRANDFIVDIIDECHSAMRLFFCSPEFRSERMEKAILRYLSEEETNFTVVRGLKAVQRTRDRH